MWATVGGRLAHLGLGGSWACLGKIGCAAIARGSARMGLAVSGAGTDGPPGSRRLKLRIG